MTARTNMVTPDPVTVTARPITATADAQSRNYGDANWAPYYTVMRLERTDPNVFVIMNACPMDPMSLSNPSKHSPHYILSQGGLIDIMTAGGIQCWLNSELLARRTRR